MNMILKVKSGGCGGATGRVNVRLRKGERVAIGGLLTGCGSAGVAAANSAVNRYGSRTCPSGLGRASAMAAVAGAHAICSPLPDWQPVLRGNGHGITARGGGALCGGR